MVSWNCKFNLKVLPSYYYFLFYQHWQLLLKWTDSLLYNSKTNLAEMFSMRSYTRVVTFVQICQKTWPPCDFENSDWSIFKKLPQEPPKGLNWNLVYMFLWMSLTCVVTVCAIWKFKMVTSGGQSLHWNLWETTFSSSSWEQPTEFNQTWQRCFLWGPKKLSWFVLTRPTHWVLSLLCVGQFVMPIILTWVLFRSKCAEPLLDQ